jgi:hypothetical protein
MVLRLVTGPDIMKIFPYSAYQRALSYVPAFIS